MGSSGGENKQRLSSAQASLAGWQVGKWAGTAPPRKPRSEGSQRYKGARHPNGWHGWPARRESQAPSIVPASDILRVPSALPCPRPNVQGPKTKPKTSKTPTGGSRSETPPSTITISYISTYTSAETVPRQTEPTPHEGQRVGMVTQEPHWLGRCSRSRGNHAPPPPG